MGNLKYCWIIGLIFCLDNLLQIDADDYTVLSGNYGQGGMSSIPNLRQNRRENMKPMRPQPNRPPRERDHEQSNCKTYKDVIKVYSDHYAGVMQKAKTKITEDDIKEKVDGCKQTLERCVEAATNEHVTCYLECLVKEDKLYFPVINVIHNTLWDLCAPTQTLFSRVFVPDKNGLPLLKTYRKFIDTLNISHEDFEGTIPRLGNALSVAIIKKTQTYLSPLKNVISAIEHALLIQTGADAFLAQDNPRCRTLEQWDPAEDFVAVLAKDGSNADILTPGLALWSAMSKSISSRVTQHMAVLRETVRMFTGTSTGFACNTGGAKGETGGGGAGEVSPPEADHETFQGKANGNCDELGKYPLPGFPIPPQVCGKYMSLLNPTCSGKKKDNSMIIEAGGAEEGGEATTESGTAVGGGAGEETAETAAPEEEIIVSSTLSPFLVGRETPEPEPEEA